MHDDSWKAIFEKNNILNHDFEKEPFYITNNDIKSATAHFKETSKKEVRILCKQDTRESRPNVFVELVNSKCYKIKS